MMHCKEVKVEESQEVFEEGRELLAKAYEKLSFGADPKHENMSRLSLVYIGKETI